MSGVREEQKNNKSRILFLRNYLGEHTDDDHVLTTEKLISLYEANGYKAHRQTIADDVAALNASGFEVIVEQIASNHTKTNAYHIGTRLFELAEVKMLVDAVSSSQFITAEKSKTLINKLTQLTNAENREGVVANIFTCDRIKTSNVNIFVNIDVIYHAIRNRHKILFHYWDYGPDKKKIMRHDGADYKASPYALIWNDDRYYVPSFSDARQKIVHYRVDRMCDVKETEESAKEDPTFNVVEYSKKLVRMFDGNLTEKRVCLLCENDLMKNILDRFGEHTETEIVNESCFRAYIQVVPSSTFFSWVMQFRGRILIEGPEEIQKEYEDMITHILEMQRKQFREQ